MFPAAWTEEISGWREALATPGVVIGILGRIFQAAFFTTIGVLGVQHAEPAFVVLATIGAALLFGLVTLRLRGST